MLASVTCSVAQSARLLQRGHLTGAHDWHILIRSSLFRLNFRHVNLGNASHAGS